MPSKMYYVYKYTDKSDEIIKYIGITNCIERRIKQHTEEWAQQSNYRIEYFECNNRSQAEAYESHLIALYNTSDWYNKSKSGWGIISEFSQTKYQWCEFLPSKVKTSTIKIVDKDSKKKSNSSIKKRNNKTEVAHSNGIYEFLDKTKEYFDKCLQSKNECVCLIHIKSDTNQRDDRYDIKEYMRFFECYTLYDWNFLRDNDIEIETMGNCIEISFPNGGRLFIIASMFKDDIDCYWEILRRHGVNFSPRKVNHLLIANSVNLEWEKEGVFLNLPAFAIPASNYIKERLMFGEVVIDEKNNKYFLRRSNNEITWTNCGVAHIIPFGKQLNDYIPGETGQFDSYVGFDYKRLTYAKDVFSDNFL